MPELSADNEVALELALWDSAKDGSPAELESYLDQYPQGTFASLARTRMEEAVQSTPGLTMPTADDPAVPHIGETSISHEISERIKDNSTLVRSRSPRRCSI